MTDSAIWVTGIFTLSGVAITSIAAGLGSWSRRRWAMQDRSEERRASERSELRTYRRDSYGELMATLYRAANSLTELSAGVKAGLIPSFDDLSTEADQVQYLRKHANYMEEHDAVAWRALVVSGSEVSRLIRLTDSDLSRMFAWASRGMSTGFSEFTNNCDSLAEAMRAELASD